MLPLPDNQGRIIGFSAVKPSEMNRDALHCQLAFGRMVQSGRLRAFVKIHDSTAYGVVYHVVKVVINRCVKNKLHRIRSRNSRCSIEMVRKTAMQGGKDVL